MKNKSKNFSKEPIDFILLIVVLMMLALGIIMVMSASAPTSIAESKDASAYTYVKTQDLSAILGLALMLFISKIDYKIYKGFYKLIYIGVLILLASVAVIGKEVGRSKTLD